MNGEYFDGVYDPFAGIPIGTSQGEAYLAMGATPEQAYGALVTSGVSPVKAVRETGYQPQVAGASIVPTLAGAAAAVGVPAAVVAGGLAIYEGLQGGEPGAPTDVVISNGGGGFAPRGYNAEAYLDFGGVGKYGREGTIAATRTTEGTGAIAAGTFRAWDPIKQRYYQLEGEQAYRGISLAPGAIIPGAGFITKTWITNAWRKDGSLATTQMAMLSNGRCISLSEDGRMKQWRPYRSIVLGKKMNAGTIKRFARRVKSHAKSLKTVLNIVK